MTFLVVFFTILWFIRFVKQHFKSWEKLAPTASNSMSTGTVPTGLQNFFPTSVADPDPGSGAFLAPGFGIRIRDEFFPDPGSKGYRYVFGEIFLGILVL
jgi:hypothetical protein